MSVLFPLILLIAAASPLGLVIGARWLEAMSWRRNLVAYHLRLPSKLTAEQVAQWLATVGAITHPTRWSVLPLPPVCVEVRSTERGVEFYLLVSSRNEPAVLHSIQAALPGVVLEAAPEYRPRRRIHVAAEAKLTNHARPVAAQRSEGISNAVLAALQPLLKHEEVVVQWIFTSAGTPPPVSSAASGTDRWWSTYLLDGGLPDDAEALRALRLKRQEALLLAVVRVSIAASARKRAYRLLGRIWPNLHLANGPGVRLIRRWLPSALVARRITRRSYPLTHWPLLINAREASGLLALPLAGQTLPGLATHTARRLPPPLGMPQHGMVLAVSNHAGTTGQQLAIKAADRLRHLWIHGPTGSGKSTLIARMALHDITAGSGVVVIDPKNDLVDDILRRIPEHRTDDVLLVSPAERQRPVGLNVLRAGTDEHSRELIVDNVVHIFAELWKASWGPRTSDVLRSSLLTLVHARAADQSTFTVCEIPDLLLNPAFRRFVTMQPTVPDAVRGFWSWYESLSDGERSAVIGPSLNKLRALTTRTALRLMLGQSDGVHIGTVFRDRKILLVSLSKGTVGAETAQLIGSLCLALLWQTATTRMGIPRERRRPVFAYLDEFADIVRLPISLTDMLSQARGLGLSLTLATQYIAQLPEAVRAAVLGTVRTHITMQCDYDDARLLEKRFAPLTTDDLTSLETFTVATRPSVDGRTTSPATGTTLPLSAPLHDGRHVTTRSQRHHGLLRRDVEARLQARIAVESGGPRLGRRWGGHV